MQVNRNLSSSRLTGIQTLYDRYIHITYTDTHIYIYIGRNFISTMDIIISAAECFRDLSNNNLTGPIPDFLSELPNLNIL